MAVKSATASTEESPTSSSAQQAASPARAAKPSRRAAATKSSTPATTPTTMKRATTKPATAPAAEKPAATKAPARKKATKAAPGPAARQASARPARSKPAKKQASAGAAASPKAARPARQQAAGAGAAEKSPPTKAAPDAPTSQVPTGDLQVREDESPWTRAELAAVRGELEAEAIRLSSEIDVAETGLANLMMDAGDGSGEDEADAGAKTFEREQEISLANNSRDMLDQTQHALVRLRDGTYGLCESCGNAVGKLRLQAFPRATLCLTCKQKQERR